VRRDLLAAGEGFEPTISANQLSRTVLLLTDGAELSKRIVQFKPRPLLFSFLCDP
jgi:hypothetical protein